MKKLVILVLVFSFFSSFAQELYVYTEPASNMATKSVGLRLNNYFSAQKNSAKISYLLIPEIMVGVSKRIMLHGDVYSGNNNKSFTIDGASIYAKYRFLSTDNVQTHFRMAAFARVSVNTGTVYGEEINIYGYNSGWESGVIATQLLHKVALSSGVSFVKAVNNGNNKFVPGSGNAVNYTVSAGKLLLPKEYKDYRQVNLNLMLELLSQYNVGSAKYYIDIAPAMQVIFNSQSRIDVGYRAELSSTYQRSAVNSIFVRLEHNIFNAW